MTEKKPVTEKKAPSQKVKAKKDPAEKKPAKKKEEEKRSGISFQPLRHALQPVMKNAAPKGVTGHYLQLMTLWPELTAHTAAKGSRLHKLAFPKGAQQGATLHLHVRDSSQALLLSYEKTNLQAKINQAFGYALVNDIKVMAVPLTPTAT